MLNSTKEKIKDDAMEEMAEISENGKLAFKRLQSLMAQFVTLQQNISALIADGTFMEADLSALLEDFAAYPADVRALYEQAGSLIPTAE